MANTGIVKLLGLKNVISWMTKKERKYQRGLKRGVYRAGLLIQRESQKIVPVDLGVLKGSARTDYTGNGTTYHEATVSYTAAYAIYVHEDLEASHSSGQYAKFLETPYRQNTEKIKDIIVEEVTRG